MLLALSFGCAPAETQPVPSDIQATSEDEASGLKDRTRIVKDVWGVSVAVFGRLYQASNDSRITGTPKVLARHSVTMISNMVRGKIHPVAFYATVKDFETAAILNWGGGSEGRRVFTTKNCGGHTCFGLFQVDVNSEPDWKNGAFCRVPRSSGGLDLWSLRGGPDFCAAQFWWTVALDGSKCAKLNPEGANPCTRAPLSWNLKFIRMGADAYGQGEQWGPGQWKTMYGYYKNILISLEQKSLPKDVSKQNAFDASISRWLQEVGVTSI